MADVNIPSGWKKEGDSGYYSSTSQPVAGKNWIQTSANPVTGDRIVYAIGPQISTGLTNQATGQSFDIGGTRREIMSIDASGNVTKLKHYEDTGVAIYGADGLSKIKNSSKVSATSLMSQTGLASSATKNSKEYKSALENAASTPTETGDAINGEKAEADLKALSQKIGDNPSTRKIDQYPDNSLLRYPRTMEVNQDCIKFTMLEYAPKKLELSGIAKGDPLAERSTEGKRRGSTVVLPIQPSISDSNTVRWGSEDMNAGQLIAAAAALGTITEGAPGAEASIKGITGLFKGSAESLTTAFAAGAAGAAAGTKGLLTRVTGGIVNPNTELLFQGPDLRTFSFNFSLSARDPEEAKTIRNIIRFFKQGMSVKRADTGLFLKSPNTFEIKYMFGEAKEHPWINKIKECALTSCNVNYTPAGNYATYEDGSMTQYDISLSFSELEPIYDDDYKENGGKQNESMIGY